MTRNAEVAFGKSLNGPVGWSDNCKLPVLGARSPLLRCGCGLQKLEQAEAVGAVNCIELDSLTGLK